MESTIRFKGKTYVHKKTLPTQLSDEYVPDWTIWHALRESIQNMVDETVITGAGYHYQPEHNPEGVYFFDRGRGVKFKDILYLGISGKRGVEGVVGKHGEGEVVSTMVAARNGVKKLMASQNWLATGHLEEDDDGYTLLVVEYYETDKPRNGTAWYYEGERVYEEYLDAQNEFRPPAGGKGRLVTGERGQTFTEGLRVNEISGLHFGYNLEATPGRDRSGFVLDDIKNEAAWILSENAGVDEIASLLRAMTSPWWKPEESKWELELNPELVRKAARRVAGSRKKFAMSWCRVEEDGPWMADALEQGMKVIQFQGPVPKWVSRALPNVRKVVSANADAKTKDPPRLLAEALTSLKEVMRVSFGALCVLRFEDKNTVACAVGKTSTVIFARSHIKKSTFTQFVDTVAHEAAHLMTGAADCTRTHTSMVARLLSEMSNRLALHEEARNTYLRAMKNFEEYTK